MAAPSSPAPPGLPRPRTWPKHIFRLATLLVPSWLAWYAAFSAAHAGDVIDVVAFALGALWVILTCAVALRTIVIVASRKREPHVPILEQLDVLTSGGSALAWLSALATIAAVELGWASLAVVGLLGTALFNAVVLLTFLALRGRDPMRGATITRRFVPAVVTEGEELNEEIRFLGTRIPTGFRLFVTGRVGPRFATTRHVLDASESGAEVVLESEIGPAVRGEYDAEPLEAWLQDTFGICRSVRVRVGAAHLTVLPRLREADQTMSLLDRGQGPRAARPAGRMPTEGHFRLREYQQGDDVRRIHWMRSVASRELIVRLPDELPPDRPCVRLVLDTYFPEAENLACDAPSELLDSVVSVWLAVAKALVDSGHRVTLVSAIPRGDTVTKARQELSLRTPNPALHLGAQVQWQSKMVVDELLTSEATFVVSRAVLRQPLENSHIRWIVVFPTAVSPEAPWRTGSGARFRHPTGSAENRWTRQRREETRMATARRDRLRVLGMRGDVVRPLPGSFFVVPSPTGAIRLEAVR